jgi:hypothetical protein
VVDDGVTVMLPPLAATLYVEPSEPDTFTVAAFEAVTVSVSGDPAVMVLDVGVIETAGAPAPTVTVICAVVLPCEFVAVAVYVVVELGVTVTVPPA